MKLGGTRLTSRRGSINIFGILKLEMLLSLMHNSLVLSLGTGFCLTESIGI